MKTRQRIHPADEESHSTIATTSGKSGVTSRSTLLDEYQMLHVRGVSSTLVYTRAPHVATHNIDDTRHVNPKPAAHVLRGLVRRSSSSRSSAAGSATRVCFTSRASAISTPAPKPEAAVGL